VTIPFVQAKWYTQTAGRQVDLVVLHDMEAPERPGTAEGCARYFATCRAQRSAHHCVDVDSIVQCVREEDVAWHAPGANHNGIGIEHAGYAAQSARDWADAYSERMLRNSAALAAGLCVRYGLPVEFVDFVALRSGRARGITTHAEVTKAFGRSQHTDPGPNFPMAHYLELVGTAKLPALAPVPGGPDVAHIVDVAVAPNGGVWVFARDGGVFTYSDGHSGPVAPFHGSYPGLPARDRNDPTRVLDHVELNERGGYDLLMQGTAPVLERYGFP
jgi:N-acetyl-anhydromuramyl-L-alanine amidase AmpD